MVFLQDKKTYESRSTDSSDDSENEERNWSHHLRDETEAEYASEWGNYEAGW